MKTVVPLPLVLSLATFSPSAPELPVSRSWTRALNPAPGYVSDAVAYQGGVIVADRLYSALRRYDLRGRQVAFHEKPGTSEGSLEGHVRLAAAGRKLYAVSSGALLRFDAETLKFEQRHGTWALSAAGRVFFANGRFWLVGCRPVNRETKELALFWSVPNPPPTGIGGEGIELLWRASEKSASDFHDLCLDRRLAKASEGGFWVARHDLYELAKFDSRGRLILRLSPTVAAFRPRVRPAPQLDRGDRAGFFSWLAEASVIDTPIPLGTRRVGLLRQEIPKGGDGKAGWHLDVFEPDSGRVLLADWVLPVQAYTVILLSSDEKGFELLEIDGDLLDPKTVHRWSRYEVQ